VGVFFRRLARKNRNVAVAAVARKLVNIAYLMLKNNEPYGYAVSKRVHERFTGLKFTATGKSGRPKSWDVQEAPAGGLRDACVAAGPPLRRSCSRRRRAPAARGAFFLALGEAVPSQPMARLIQLRTGGSERKCAVVHSEGREWHFVLEAVRRRVEIATRVGSDIAGCYYVRKRFGFTLWCGINERDRGHGCGSNHLLLRRAHRLRSI